ncbi:n-acetylglucosaminyl transferase component gpi1 [Lasallia pustulata]|uniref:N-acetylglucosaminyl transferase component gpi1 n=1 Tax=Lasallia pustulata TaxID=136370 RepID=A0A1W5D258_9LECA|nr:n-acetylglucosaminyl transferase component gpi1 [Lasallia pustulata]
MHPFSVLTLGIFIAGYITARWDLVTRLYELAIFAWDHSVVSRAAKGFAILSVFFFLFIVPVERVAAREASLVIMFNRPSPWRMQYMSLEPISLILVDQPPSSGRLPQDSDAEDTNEGDATSKKSSLIEKLRLHTVLTHSPSPKELSLPLILNQINCSSEIAQLLYKNIHLIGVRQKRSLSVSEMVVESASTVWDYFVMALRHLVTVWVYPIITRIFVVGLICHRVVAEVVLQILEWRPHPGSAALKDVSATAQQVDIRLQQFCYWPIQYLTLRKRKDDWDSVTDSHPDYIRFYNSLWLVANDVIIGIALGSYIIDNASWVALQINRALSGWTVEGLQSMILWLMDWPAGLKLNNELAAFLGDLFLWVIDYWAGL